MGRVMTLVTGMAAGAGLMWFLDPQQGERRRALLRERLNRALAETRDLVDETSREIADIKASDSPPTSRTPDQKKGPEAAPPQKTPSGGGPRPH